MQYVDENFENVTVSLDGHTFDGCTFHGCQLQYGGTTSVHLDRCTFDGCYWSFTGAAANTFAFLSMLANSGGPGGRSVVEEAFANILAGTRQQQH